MIQADGHEITYTYNARNELTSYVDAEGYTHSYTYDKDGRLTAMTDALGYATTFTYDAMDRVVKVTDAREGETTYTYTKRGEVATETDAEGYVISYEYDGNGNCVKMTTVDGDTIYEYDPLDRLIKTTTPDGESTSMTYDAIGNVATSTDANGNTTTYVYDGVGNVVETKDALGNSALFEYDAMGNLTKTKLHRVDKQDKVDEWEVTLYEFDGRGLVTKQVDALGNVTTYTYDGNGNLVSTKDADGKTTTYSYNCLDLVTSINYNEAKNVSYRYNKTGDLVYMKDWLGETTFEVDLLHQITAATDHKGKRVEYTYDGVGNQTAIHYPDGTAATYDYDLVQNRTKVTESDSSQTIYTYDGMGRVTEMRYPNGWVEYYSYDAMGRLLSVEDTHPSEKPAKTQKHTYKYDANGNMTYEYMRGNGTGQAKNETKYTYDELDRLVKAHDTYGNSTRKYTYDSLGNLTYETADGSHKVDYLYNNLNQLVDQSDDKWKTHTESSYDKRGNLIQEVYHKNEKTANPVGKYLFDETNKMVRGTNAAGEESHYAYNGLGALMEQTWVIAQNGYGYHGVNAGTSDNPSYNGQGNGNGVGSNNADNNGNGNVKKTSTVIKQFVVDFTSETYKPLMEHEVNGLDYRYVNSGLDRLSVVVQGIENGSASLLDERNELHAYYHCDYLGTTDYLTSAVNSKVISWTDYNEWGEITHNAVLKCGQRELDLVKEYATHDFDSVLTMYYAKARFYDADNRRFTAVDPILDPSQYAIADYVSEVHQLNQYLYVMDNAVNGIDPLGLFMNYTVLYRGMPNMDKYYHDIKALQEELIRRGYNLKDSGTFDQKTENAVNKYKDRVMPGGNKGENRGKVGYSTWLKLGLKFSKPFGVFYGIPGLAFNWDIHQGKWYSPVDAIQRGFGYDDNLDTLFKACDYVRVKSVFKFNNKNWMIECWKGNYFNMGVGAEIGVYQNPGHVTIDYYERPYCLSTGFHNDAVENNNMLYMNFSLYYDDGFSKSLILSRITTKHWWLNGFRPFIECDSKNLTVRGEIFFLSKAMADAFRAGIKGDGDSRDDSKNFHTMEPAEARVDGEIWKYYKVTFTWGKV